MQLLTDFRQDDIVSNLLRLVRLRSSLYCRSEMTAPWGIHMQAGKHSSMHVVLDGNCWLVVTGVDKALRLSAGDLVIRLAGQEHAAGRPQIHSKRAEGHRRDTADTTQQVSIWR